MRVNFALLFCASLVLSACASTPVQQAAPSETSSVSLIQQEQQSGQPLSGVASDSAAGGQHIQSQSEQNQSVYFDFDQYMIKPEYRELIRQQASKLNEGSAKVTLEGNADERGSSEYNLALGDKRATAVKKNLELLGVRSSQIEVVSFGELQPRETCHEERCWKENRRVDFNSRQTMQKAPN